MAEPDDERIVLEVSRAELALINNALNEVCHGLHFGPDEFSARLGDSRERAQALLRRVAERLGP